MRVTVVGMGKSGVAAAKLAASTGAEVVGVDLKADLEPIEGVRLELGPHRRETFLGADLVVVSPGVLYTQPDVRAAEEAGVPVIGELGFAASFLDVPTIAVTGTNGKSTVTHFTGQFLSDRRIFVGGNLGNPLSNAVGMGPLDWLVVEVSSYQLERPGDFRPRIGVVLNLTPDHLARHGDMDTYGELKCRLFARMDELDFAILPSGDERLARLAGWTRATRLSTGAHPGWTREGKRVRIDAPGVGQVALDLSDFSIPGEHNKDNCATAALMALLAGVPPGRVQELIPTLTALDHRMQIVAEIGGVTWVNDSKATNVDSTRVAIEGIDRPAVVLLGGQAKGDGFVELAAGLRRQRAVVTFGGSGPAIADELATVGVTAHRTDSMEDAMALAETLAEKGDMILLSPGCASFDAFKDFTHRGRVFAELVHARRSRG